MEDEHRKQVPESGISFDVPYDCFKAAIGAPLAFAAKNEKDSGWREQYEGIYLEFNRDEESIHVVGTNGNFMGVANLSGRIKNLNMPCPKYGALIGTAGATRFLKDLKTGKSSIPKTTKVSVPSPMLHVEIKNAPSTHKKDALTADWDLPKKEPWRVLTDPLMKYPRWQKVFPQDDTFDTKHLFRRAGILTGGLARLVKAAKEIHMNAGVDIHTYTKEATAMKMTESPVLITISWQDEHWADTQEGFKSTFFKGLLGPLVHPQERNSNRRSG